MGFYVLEHFKPFCFHHTSKLSELKVPLWATSKIHMTTLDLAVDLAIDSNNFHFMVLLTTHTTNTTKKHNTRKVQQITISKLKPK